MKMIIYPFFQFYAFEQEVVHPEIYASAHAAVPGRLSAIDSMVRLHALDKTPPLESEDPLGYLDYVQQSTYALLR